MFVHSNEKNREKKRQAGQSGWRYVCTYFIFQHEYEQHAFIQSKLYYVGTKKHRTVA